MKRYLLVAVLALAGCGVKAPIMARQDPYLPAQIQIASDGLRNRLAVDAPRLTRDGAGLLIVTVPVRAATDQQLYVDYRVTFLDASGQVLSQSSWLSKTLAPNVFDQITVNSTDPRAADFQLALRWAQ